MLKQGNALDLAWAAGLFDGEGSTFAYRMRTKIPKKGLRVSIGQDHNPEVLHRFHQAVGRGSVYGGPGQKRDGTLRKYPNRYTFTSSGEDALIVLHLLWPYLSKPKKRQAQRAYRIWRTNDNH